MNRLLLVAALLASSAGHATFGGPSWGGGGTPSASLGADNYDVNSVIPSHVDEPVWTLDSGGTASPLAYPNGNPDDEGFHRMVWINPQRASHGTELRYVFIAPPGSSTATFTVPAQRPFNAGFSGTLSSIQIKDGSDSSSLCTTNLNLTATTVTTFTCSASVTPGTQYFARITLGSADFLVRVGRVRVTFDAATGVFGAPFNRYEVTPQLLHDNATSVQNTSGSTMVNNSMYLPSSGARFVFETTANSFVAETIANGNLGVAPTIGDLLVYINGELSTTPIQPSATGSTILQQTFTLPASLNGKLKRIEIVHGFTTETSVGSNAYLRASLRAVYIPSAAFTHIVPPANTARAQRVLIVGDSILTGSVGNAFDARESVGIMLRKMVPQAQIHLDGVWAANSIFTTAGTAAKLAVSMQRWRPLRPDVVVIQLGTNDYNSSTMTQAAFAVAYSNLVDAMRAAWPGAVIQLMTPIVRGTETANSNGDTLPNFRTQITTIATLRGLPTPLDGSTMLTTADEPDGVHPGDDDTGGTVMAGLQKVSGAIAIALNAEQQAPMQRVYKAVLTTSPTNATTTFSAQLTLTLPLGTWQCTAVAGLSDSVAADGAKARIHVSTAVLGATSKVAGEIKKINGSTAAAIQDAQVSTTADNTLSSGAVANTDAMFATWSGTAVVTTAGDITLDFAQFAHSTGTATLAAGSFLRCEIY